MNTQNGGGQEEPFIYQQVRKMLGQEPEIPEVKAPEGMQPEEVRQEVEHMVSPGFNVVGAVFKGELIDPERVDVVFRCSDPTCSEEHKIPLTMPEAMRIFSPPPTFAPQPKPAYRYQPDPVHADIASLRSAIRLQNMVINELKEMVRRFADEQLYMATDVSGAKERVTYLEQELAEAKAKIADMSLLVPSVTEVEQSVRTSRTGRRWRPGWPWR